MMRKSIGALRAMFALSAFLAAAAQASHTAATSLGTSSGGSINTESAIPLDAGSWSVGLRSEQQQSDRLSDEELLAIKNADPDADVHSVDTLISNTLLAAYGVTADVTLGITLPWIERQDVRAPEDDGGGVELHQDGDSTGIGDARVYWLWRFFQDAASTQNMALIFGSSVPIGKDDEKTKEGELFKAEFQPGSGSWDPFASLAYSRGFGRVGLDASVSYTLVNQGSQSTDLGDYLAYNAGLSFGLTPDAPLRWNAVLELNGLHRDKQETHGESNANSGGDWINLAPGITVSGKHWGAYANFGFPIVDEPNGDQDEQDYRFLVGFRYLH